MTTKTLRYTPLAITLTNPACLHCTVSYTIGLWAMRYAPRMDGVPILAPRNVATTLARVTAEFVAAMSHPSERAAVLAEAHAALETAFAAKKADTRPAEDLAHACAAPGLH